jgi:hypothetical protein
MCFFRSYEEMIRSHEKINMMRPDKLDPAFRRHTIYKTHPELWLALSHYGIEASVFVMNDLQTILRMDKEPTDDEIPEKYKELKLKEHDVLLMLKRNQLLRRRKRVQDALEDMDPVVVPESKIQIVRKPDPENPKREVIFTHEPSAPPLWK